MRESNHENRDGRKRSPIGRRSYLAMAGALASAPLFVSRASAFERSGIDFARRIRLGEKGLRNGDRIDDVVRKYEGDDRLLVVPPGEYRLDRLVFSDRRRFGLVGADPNDPPVLKASADSFRLLYFLGGEDVLFENLIVDRRPGGSGAVGGDVDGDFRMTNVVKRGTSRIDGGGGLRASTSDPNGLVVVERCAVPDGGEGKSGRAGPVGFFVNKRHAGELRVIDCHVEGFSNNGLYASAPGNYGENGVTHVRGGLWKNNNIAGIRLASRGDSVRGATVVNDDSVSFAYTTNRRGIRMREPEGNNVIADCDVVQNGDGSDGPIVIANPKGGGGVRNCRIRTDNDSPAVRLKGGDPNGWRAVDNDVTGSGDSEIQIPESGTCRGDGCERPSEEPDPDPEPEPQPDPGSSLPNEITVVGTGEYAEYEFSVDGDLAYLGDHRYDSVSGSTATGTTENIDDTYRYSGSITGFRADGPVRVLVNGQKADVDALGNTPGELRIRGSGERSTYEFTVSGGLLAGPTFDTDGTDRIDGSSGSGRVAGTSDDDYRFGGEITEFSHDGPLRVFVDGDEVDPDSFGGSDHTLSIVGESGVLVEYTLEISGTMAKSDARDATIDDNDTLSGSLARGQVNGGTDSYEFDGEIEHLSTEPPFATVYLDDEEVNPTTLGLSNRIVIDDREYNGAVDYEFTVSGDLAAAESPAGDRVSGRTASGRANAGRDGYYFSGEITDFAASRDTDVYVNGEASDLAAGGELLTIERASGSDGSVEYIVETTGRLETVAQGGASINAGDEVRGRKARGTVSSGTDAYRVTSGKVTDVSAFGGEVVVRIDGEKRDFAD